mmetsp:Transcript_4677/g.9431  ORF Transcript_4677/g.9431 Transcript_4677/m.9431 type:complete len:377 (+) Transcript_4677:2895-4025(+)
MLNNRPKNGDIEFDWTRAALGRKYARKTIELTRSKEDAAACDAGSHCRRVHCSVFIRELNLASGGLGCALWDGGVVLARWIFQNPTVFHGRSVLELGAGCGLAGIICGRFADSVVLTDCNDRLIDNIHYNIAINSTGDSDGNESSDVPDNGLSCQCDANSFRQDLSKTVNASFLDWDGVFNETCEKADSSSFTTNLRNVCTRVDFGRAFASQQWFHCRTCFGGSGTDGVCAPCSNACHKDHDVELAEISSFRCDCPDEEGRCLASSVNSKHLSIEPVDIIIGSELTYCLLSVSSLLSTVDKYLKQDGVFYEVLSEDRDGVEVFVEQAKRAGFIIDVFPVPETLIGRYNTRKWSFQDTERYRFYTFRRTGSQHPVMR